MPDPKQRVAKTPDGKLHYFPADATDQEISDILNAAPTPKDGNARKSTKSWVDVAVDAIPMLGGALGAGFGATAGLGVTLPGGGGGAIPGGVIGATTGGALGEATKNTINAFRGKDAPNVGQGILDAAGEGVTQGMFEGGPRALFPEITRGAKAVYRGVLKPSLERLSLSDARAVIDAAFKEGIAVTAKGLGKAQNLLGELGGRVDTLLKDATGRTVDLNAIADEVRAFAKRRYFIPGQPSANYDAAMKVADEIDKHASLPQVGGVTQTAVDLPTAQTVKRGLDTSITDSAFGVETASATKEAQKVGRHGLRVGIEQQVPDIASLNMRESPLIGLARELQMALGREGNKDQILGTRTLLSGVLGYGAGHANPIVGGAVALATRIGASPAAVSNIAILASKMAEKMPTAAAADIARAATQAVLEANGQQGMRAGTQAVATGLGGGK